VAGSVEGKHSVAQSNNRRTPSGKSGATSKGVQPKAGQPKSPQPTTPQPKPAAAKGSPAVKKPAAGRQSVAAARRSSSGNNRTQLIIGAIAVVVIIAIIIFGLVLNKKETAVQGEGYGASTQSVATVANGVVTVAKPGATPGKTIDVFEDALCPICSEFERQFGQQMNQAVDQGDLAVNYHMLNFLNPRSFSGDYSTRAAAALLCVAEEGGTQPGLYLNYHSALFSTDNQPAEGGSADLTNEQLAQLATTTGAPTSAASCITAGTNIAAATAAADASSAALQAATGRIATPTVLYNGAPVSTTVDWLSTLLGQ
jgi:protein-disulfide isomerase